MSEIIDAIESLMMKIKDTPDEDKRKRLESQLRLLLSNNFNFDQIEYDGSVVINRYINWDSNCEGSIVTAELDPKIIWDDIIEYNLSSDFSDVIEIMGEHGERNEWWADIFAHGHDLSPLNEYDIGNVIYDLEEMVKGEYIGEEEFIKDFEEYRKEKANENINKRAVV